MPGVSKGGATMPNTIGDKEMNVRDIPVRKDQKHNNAKKRQQQRGTQKQEVAQASLPWSAVALPQEAAAGSGQDDEDFFQGFSVDDADYMGLTEVQGVEVVRDADGLTKFLSSSSSNTKGKDEKKVQQRKEKSSPKRESEESTDADVVASKSAKRSEKKEKEASVEIPHFNFESEEEDKEEINTGTSQQDNFSTTDFTLLAEAEEGEGSAQRWTRKDVSQKLPQWAKIDVHLHSLLYQALHMAKFEKPTDIQSASLPLAIGRSKSQQANQKIIQRDVVGIAQTGSGKTLAYTLPILNWIASNSPDDRQLSLLDNVTQEDSGVTRLAALVVTPTRELALQVAQHIAFIIDASCAEAGKRWASVATLTGGMSEEKQRRMLQGYRGRGVDIVVATPGRLWDVCKSEDAFVRRVKTTRFLVVDEADRMIETGHFAELQNIFALVQRITPTVVEDGNAHHSSHAARILGGAQDMQTMIFSATLSKDLQHNLKRANRGGPKRRKNASLSTLDELFEAIDFRDEDPAVVDQSTETRIAENVFEVKAECLQKDKDLYLYYFLLRFPGRTLIFVNAIDGIRRLQPLLENLGIAVQPLHSQLQQKQRLKNMDRFRSQNVALANGRSSVLLATDVAARGLDVSSVDHVVHFQIPRTADTYVHRCGRTARAGSKGVALALIDPSEKRVWQALCKSLGRKESALASMPIEYAFLTELRKRIDLARQIDKTTHAQKKEAHDDAWLRNLAQEADMDMSDDEDERRFDEDGGGSRKGKKQSTANGGSGGGNANTAALRAQLRQMLQTPLRARGVSFRYITSGSRDFLETLLGDQHHDQMLGVERLGVQANINKQHQKQKANNNSTTQQQQQQQQQRPQPKRKAEGTADNGKAVGGQQKVKRKRLA